MNASAATSPLNELRAKLAEVRSEASKLEAEIARMEKRGQLELPAAPVAQQAPRSPAEKVALFLDLFGTRRSVFPKRWENAKTGKSGYAPACDNEWRQGMCRKPQIKCSECPHQKFPPLDAQAIEAHLRGIHTLGVYAMADDNSCRFLAADFDGDGWKDNISAYRDAGSRAGVPIAMERSRSGCGGHAWIFFSEPVPASLARKLGVMLLAKASALKPTMGLDAFDRFFPNQDAVAVGGFGNLIALPLAKQPRQDGNTMFLDEEFRPIPDQWEYLASLQRLSRPELQDLVGKMAPLAPLHDASSEPPDLALRTDEATLDLTRPIVHTGMLTGELTVRLDSQIHVPRTIPITVLAALKRLASFANPVYHEKLRLRFPTFDIPRFLFAGEWRADRLVLPRGVLDPCLGILERAGATVSVQDQRDDGTRCAWKFHGELRPEQQTAVRETAGHDFGVLCAPPGAGKTVMGCALIARHRTSTLVLVHRALLLDQWRESAMRFLGLNKKEIGVWKGARPRITRRLDIAMLPSLSRAQYYTSALSGYGLVLVDECHHVPAASFEILLKACPARHIVGLTATPQRKDRLEKLLYLQCGPIRHTLASAGSDESNPRLVVVRRSSIAFPSGMSPQPAIHEVWDALVADEGRLQMIVADICACVEEGRAPLVLADRKSYLDRIEASLAAHPGAGTVGRYRLESGVGKKARANIRRQIDEHYEKNTPFVLLATASLIGEGFDLPQLDTLVLAMPLSFKGRLIQYAGRLHRDHQGKSSARIYDYLDENSPLTRAMFRRRSEGYRQMGYHIDHDSDSASDMGGTLDAST